ncbi:MULTISPECIES: sulfotransferase [unclassified Mycobacterium]|uniref:sulfotransferase family protein n=1 Tax=unclassified Mycobacterium TaxID=2642494 RepID=UPI0029C99268|nr:MULTISPECIES: sulfotransferase [unclassified Mycobacterium]
MTHVKDKTGIAAARWAPPQRPRWVRLLNQVGSNLGEASALVALDEASLLATAQHLTGLDDFGDDAWREPFGLLLADVENEAKLNLTGRLLTRYDLLRSLMFRLRMTEAEKRHPEILDEQITEPIFITGLGRTGTSILHESMAQDPRLRAPLGWELRYPGLEPGDDDKRVAMTAAEVDLWLEVIPEFAPIHEISIDGPDEDSVGLQHEFASQVWGGTNRVPNFDMWMATKGWTQAFAFERRLLRHLQFGKPGRWILKGIYAACLPNLFAEFPDARVVMTHRDPLKVLASMANMLSTLRWQRSDAVDYDEIVAPLGFGIPFLLDMVVEQRKTGVVPNDRFVDVGFADLMADHMGTLGRVYEELDMDLTDEAATSIGAYLDAKPRGRHGAHAYSVDTLGLDPIDMRTKFANYMSHFNVPEEHQ